MKIYNKSGQVLIEVENIKTDLRDSDLSCANLRDSDLSYSDLHDADLIGANLRGADLRGAYFDEKYLISLTNITPEGTITGYKKCRNDIIVKLEIPAEAKRSNATTTKCRAEWVKVIEIYGADKAISEHDGSVVYRVGEVVICHKWDNNRWNECSGGIHFFLTREEAERW